MPKATVSHDHIKYDLTSLEGGFVRLRKLSYEEVLKRRDGAARLFMEQTSDTDITENGDRTPTKMELETAQLWSRKFEFRACIVEHNLEDDNERLLDFKSDMAFKILEPKIAIEIEKLIDRINGEDDEARLQDFTSAASTYVEDRPGEQSESTVES